MKTLSSFYKFYSITVYAHRRTTVRPPPNNCAHAAEQLCAHRPHNYVPVSFTSPLGAGGLSFGRSDDQFARKLLLTPAF